MQVAPLSRPPFWDAWFCGYVERAVSHRIVPGTNTHVPKVIMPTFSLPAAEVPQPSRFATVISLAELFFMVVVLMLLVLMFAGLQLVLCVFCLCFYPLPPLFIVVPSNSFIHHGSLLLLSSLASLAVQGALCMVDGLLPILILATHQRWVWITNTATSRSTFGGQPNIMNHDLWSLLQGFPKNVFKVILGH